MASPFLKKIFTTTVASVLSMLAMVIIFRWLGKGFGAAEFGAYSLSRRIIASITPLGIMAMDVALSRYIAMSESLKMRMAFVCSAALLASLMVLSICFCGWMLSDILTEFLFHDMKYRSLFHASLFLFSGYCLFLVVYAMFLGLQKVYSANVLHILIVTILPLTIAFFYGSGPSADRVVALMGAACYLSIIPFILEIRKLSLPAFGEMREAMAVLCKYGIPRLPAGFGLGGLFALGPMLAAIFGSVADAGFFNVGQAVFRILEAAVVAFGLVALPRIAQLHAEGKNSFLKENIENLLFMIFHLGIFFTLHSYLWADEIILIWLGVEYENAIPIAKVILFSLTPYLAYVMLRSVVDGIEVRPVNTINLYISLSIAALASTVLFFSGMGTIGLAVGTMLGFLFLGVLTARFLIKRYRIVLSCSVLLTGLVINICLAIAGIVGKRIITLSLDSLPTIAAAVLFEITLAAIYFFILLKKQTGWIMALKSRFRTIAG